MSVVRFEESWTTHCIYISLHWLLGFAIKINSFNTQCPFGGFASGSHVLSARGIRGGGAVLLSRSGTPECLMVQRLAPKIKHGLGPIGKHVARHITMGINPPRWDRK